MKDAPFYNESQAEFWRHIQPNIRMALEMLEGMENWTFFMEELPNLFISSSQLLPQISKLSIADESCPAGDIARNLNYILSVMPFRQCIYSLAWLEKHSEGDVGWGTLCYVEAETIFADPSFAEKDRDLFLASKIIYSRIQALLILDVATKIFSSSFKISIS